MSLELQRIHKDFTGSGRSLFQSLSLTLNAPELVAVIGPSGCGKSTLLRLIAGLDQPSSGTIVRPVGERLGFVFQEPRLLPWRTVRENILLGPELKGQVVSESTMIEVLRLVQLNPEVLRLFPHQLSGGMKMRVALVRALILKPELLLLDEPLAALDESTRMILQEEIARIHEASGRLTLLVTHSLTEAVFLADRIVVLGREGQLVRDFKIEFSRPRNESLRLKVEFMERVVELQRQFRGLLATDGEAHDHH